MIPAKADPGQQAVFLQDVLETRLAEAKAGQRAVFFVDAAHFVLAAFLGYLWSLKRIFIQALSLTVWTKRIPHTRMRWIRR